MIATTHRRAFTIVEMMVVIGIIAILLGILLPALSGVQKRSAKLRELNSLRGVGQAWTMYANSNSDAALPGYLDGNNTGLPTVQELWRVRYEYPVPDPVTGNRTIPQDVAAPWTWRLLSYLDHNYDLIWGYRREVYDAFTLVERAPDVALEPAFGYNGYYVGGYWDTQEHTLPEGGGTVVRARMQFSNATTLNGGRLNVVVRTLPSIQRPSELIIFCSASRFRGNNTAFPRVDDTRPGWHIVTPPFLANAAQWTVRAGGGGGGGNPGGGPGPSGGAPVVELSSVGGDPYTITAFVNDTYAPIGRYNRLVPVLRADGSTDAQTPSALSTQRPWIDTATDRMFRHNP